MIGALAWLAVGDRSLLAQMPRTERNWFVQLAIMLLSASCIAAAAMFFALRVALGVSPIFATFLAIAWGIVILNIDRFVAISLSESHRRGPQLLTCLIQAVLVALTAIVVTEPVVLRIYASEVAAQIRTTHSGPGLVAQVEALSQLGQHQTVVAWSAPVIGALYFAVGILPCAVALIRPSRLYEALRKNEEEYAITRAKLEREFRLRAANLEVDKRVKIEEDRRQKELELNEYANKFTAQTTEELLSVALRDWRKKAQEAMLAREPDKPRTTPQSAPEESAPEESAQEQTPPYHTASGYALPEDSELL